jgi:hypothetical protein
MDKSMKRPTLLLIGIIIASSIVLCAKRVGADQTASPSSDLSSLNKKAVPWSAKMQELYKALSELLTDVTSNGRFNDPKNKVRIQAEAEKLASLVHDLNKKEMIRVDVDPTVQMVAEMLGRETKHAAAELKRGNRDYARTILRSVPTYCIACHTRNASGVQFSELPLEPSSGSLSPVERGQFFAASRQFDRAQDQFKSVIQDPETAVTNIFEWEQAVHQSLAIAVRVKNDPAQAREIAKTILKTPNAPSFMKEDAKTWMVSINEWQQELPHHEMTEEGLYAEAVRLMGKARETQKYPMDRTADVYYLRASAATHDLLQVAPKGMHSGEALLLAGLSYEVLSPVNMEDLHEAFYGACIRSAPHSPTAEICYRRLEADITADFTGSAGTDIPEDVRLSLKDLQQVSQPTLINVRQ